MNHNELKLISIIYASKYTILHLGEIIIAIKHKLSFLQLNFCLRSAVRRISSAKTIRFNAIILQLNTITVKIPNTINSDIFRFCFYFQTVLIQTYTVNKNVHAIHLYTLLHKIQRRDHIRVTLYKRHCIRVDIVIRSIQIRTLQNMA